LTVRSAQTRTVDLSPLSFIVQLVETDAFQILAGPSDAFAATAQSTSWLDPILRFTLFLGLAVAIGKTIVAWIRRRAVALTPELAIVLWWISPALAAIYRPVPVYIHHFLATMPSQFLLVSFALDWLADVATGSLEWIRMAPIRRRLYHGFGHDGETGHLRPPPTIPREGLPTRLPGSATLTAAVVGGSHRALEEMIPSALTVALALLVSLLQMRTFASYLPFIETHPSGTYFGVPLKSSLVAADEIRRAVSHGPVFVLSHGNLVGVSEVPTVIESLVAGAPVVYLDSNQTLVLPARTDATYVVAPDSIGHLDSALSPWQEGNPVVSRVETLPGGYERFRARPPGSNLPIGWRGLKLAQEDGAEVIGYEAPRQIKPGATFEVDVLWRIGEPAAQPVSESVFAHLVDDHGQNFGGEDFAPLPTSRWVEGQEVINRFHVSAPSDLPPGRYWIDFGRYRRPGVQPVRVVAEDGAADAASVLLGPLSVPPVVRPLPGLRPSDALFGNQIRLAGWNLHRNRTTLDVSLLWEAVRPPSADYHVFVHLETSTHKVVAQDDSTPLDGQFPTITWLPGDRALDVHEISLAHVAPGRYDLVVGLYTLNNGQRLPVGASTAELLKTIRVRGHSVS
jgi:hypothetical protein